MKIVPMGGQAPTVDPATVRAQNTRDSVVAKIEAIRSGKPAQAQQAPVQNPTRIAPEELSAIKPRQEAIEEATQEETGTEQLQALSQDETPAEETPKVDPLSTQHALLARKEKALRAKAQQQEQQFRQREDALRQKEIDLAAKGGSREDLSNYISKDQLKANPLKALLEAGSSYDELVQQVIQNQTPMDPRTEATINELRSQIQELKQANETNTKQISEREQQAYQAAIKQIATDAKKLVFTDPAFELVKATNSVNDVVELIEAHYKESGDVMSVEDAAQQVEDYLAEEAIKLAKLSKIQKRLQTAIAKPAATNVQTPQGPKQPQPMKTLTNAASSSRQLSSKERAILAFRGELKS